MDLTFVIPIAGLAALAFAGYLAWDVLRQDRGTSEMKSIADAIMEGAKAFLKRQYRTIAVLAVISPRYSPSPSRQTTCWRGSLWRRAFDRA